MEEIKWDVLFAPETLQKGKAYFEKGKAKNLVEQPDGFDVIVRGSRNYRVRIDTQMKKGYDYIMGLHCECDKGEAGICCKHEAAALFLISEEYDVMVPESQYGKTFRNFFKSEEEQPMQELMLLQQQRLEELAETDGTELGSRSDETSQYFQFQNFHKNLGLSPKVLRDAQQLVDKGKLDDTKISIYYGTSASTGQEALIGESHLYYGNQFPSCSITYERDGVTFASCSKWDCRYEMENSGRSRIGYIPCVHIAAMILKTEAYLKEKNPGDFTNLSGMNLLNGLRNEGPRKVETAGELMGDMIHMHPVVKQDEPGSLTVGFKIGTNRLYKVKKFKELLENVQKHQVMQFGKNTMLQMGEEYFDEEAGRWYRFIRDVMNAEDQRKSRRRPVRYYGYYEEEPDFTDAIPLYGNYLDLFYKSLGDGTAIYEKESGRSKDTSVLAAGSGETSFQLRLRLEQETDGEEFKGVRLTGTMPELLDGQTASYYIENDKLCRVDGEMARRMEPLARIAKHGAINAVIGRNNLAEFYHKSLPVLRQLAVIEEGDRSLIDQYLPPKPEFTCYFDLEQEMILCRAEAAYGSRVHSLFDRLDSEDGSVPERYRDAESEGALLNTLVKYLNRYDPTVPVLYSLRGEDSVFDFLSEGINEVLALSEVRVTDRFKKLQIKSSFKVSVGVGVTSTLMDLEVHSEELSDEELLDILNSYRAKKRYYRLKNGDFVSLTDNDTVEQLSYMLETMRIPLKQFVSGKMQLPAYRALYLDKMLEQTEGVYAERDSHFKRLIKEFKAVEDSDFEIPAALRKVLRKYQKTGYRWLRTIDHYGFGGILADEMGLGKTLQMISVLLADKQEHPEEHHVSLIVCPASLVYNWGEEIKRFAPSLTCLLVTGTKAERSDLIAECGMADVVVTSYDLLKRDIDEYEEKHFRFEVIDEAQMVKNPNTAASKSVKVIKSDTRFALTGTPIENRLSELWSIFDYLMPGFLYDYQSFKQNLETPIVKRQDEEAKRQLQRMVAPFILRRKKQAVLKDLPEKLEEVRYAGMSAKQQKLYDGQVVKLKQLLQRQSDEDYNKNRIQVLSELTRIRQVCCDPSLLYEDYKGESAKRESLMELIDGIIEGEHKALVFSQFTSMFELIEKDLNERGIAYYKITGSTPKQKRLELVNAFNADQVPIFLISLKAGGTGLNLTGADVVVHYDPWWNVAAQNQATDRAHRIGQAKVVTVYKLIVKDTIEEKILEMQETKQKLAEDILGGEAVGSARISREELLSLLG